MAKKPNIERKLPIPFDTRYFNVRYFNRHGDEFIFYTVGIEKFPDEVLVKVVLHENEELSNLRFVDTILLEMKTKQDLLAFERVAFLVDASEDFIDTLCLDSSVEGTKPVITLKYVVRESKFGDNLIWIEHETTGESSDD